VLLPEDEERLLSAMVQ